MLRLFLPRRLGCAEEMASTCFEASPSPLCDTNKTSAAWGGAGNPNPNPNPNGMEHENQTAARATFPTSHHVTPLIRLTARDVVVIIDEDH